jgi:hypothetical protein
MAAVLEVIQLTQLNQNKLCAMLTLSVLQEIVKFIFFACHL